MKTEYQELTRMVERLHRRYLDVIRAELARIGRKDINAVQALLLVNIGDEEIVIRDLVQRGYYLGSNVSYNIKKLTELGFLDQERSAHDRRSVRIRLTDKALDMVRSIAALEERNIDAFGKQETSDQTVQSACDVLRQLERIWADSIQYGSV